MIKLPELLAPAGSPEALAAAIEAGADAVYFGGELFSNRMRAKNFTHEELCSAIKLCRAYGVKSYITMNTRLRDREMEDALSLARLLYEAGADAFIVADIGLARVLREAFPGIELHASTQMTGINSLDARAIEDLGFTRMVCPRELSMNELCQLVKGSPIEIEMFIHGAHCVSVSGQCLMSWAMGGRSGNRGECAQPCRLPYRVSNSKGIAYPLSLKDMCLARYIPQIIDSGVSSLKIEGRLKSPDYVYGVVKIYRALLDERRAARPDEIDALNKIFSRDGFTDGYIRGRFTSMTGMRAEGTPSIGEKFTSLTRKVPLKARIFLSEGECSVLELSCGDVKVSVEGSVVQSARSAPLGADAVFKNISKLGATHYSLSRDDFECEIKGDVFMQASALNELRRAAVEMLESARDHGIKRTAEAKITRRVYPSADHGKLISAEFAMGSDVPAEAFDVFDVVFLPPTDAFDLIDENGSAVGLALSPWYGSASEVTALTERFAKLGGKHVLCHTLGQIAAARDAHLVPTASYRLNITCKDAYAAVTELGADHVILSAELNGPAISDMTKAFPTASSVVYGRLPLMLLRRCIMSDVKCSGNCGGAGCLLPGSISDRKGAKLIVYPIGGRCNVIYNSVPVYTADKKRVFDGTSSSHFIFTCEDSDEAVKMIRAYQKGLSPEKAGLDGIKRV